jgi:L-iditol 2-dehydrogenase
VRRALTCGTDLKILERGHPRVALPLTMGHELAGEIESVGDGVTGWKAGRGSCRRLGSVRDAAPTAAAGARTSAARAMRTAPGAPFAERIRVPASVVAATSTAFPTGFRWSPRRFSIRWPRVLHGWGRLRAPAGNAARLWLGRRSRSCGPPWRGCTA